MKKDIEIAALLHDIGKMVTKSKNDIDHVKLGIDFLQDINNFLNKKVFNDAMIDAVKYHHSRNIEGESFENKVIAYFVHEADYISADIDRKEEFGKDETDNKAKELPNKYIPLRSIYCLINHKSNDKVMGKYYSDVSENFIQDFILPSKKVSLSQKYYEKLYEKFKNNLLEIIKNNCDKGYINSLLELIKTTLYYVPSVEPSQEKPDLECDISLYLHSKLTACLAVSLYDFFNNKNIKYCKLKERRTQKTYLMASVDLSGIQKFIYTITTEQAQKQLRARSIYLELIMENLIDEILNNLGYSRCNLLYSGGGHCYILIGNTESNKDEFKEIIKQQNNWFIDNMGIALYAASATEDCSANHLRAEENKKQKKENFYMIFDSLSDQLSKAKTQRYDLDQITRLNSDQKYGSRECKFCGLLTQSDNDMCDICDSLIYYSPKFLEKDSMFVITNQPIKDKKSLKMFSYKANEIDKNDNNNKKRYNDNYLYVCSKDEIGCFPQDQIVRIYSKNSFEIGHPKEIKIYMGDYHKKGYTFDEYAQKSIGIKRLGVLRADVDNLGATLKHGLDIHDEINYSTISRITALSESLSMFFKYYINEILENRGKYSKVSLINNINNSENRNLSVVYSGGDDLFIIGSWNEVLEFALDLHYFFRQYTCEKLTFSASFAMYPCAYPFAAIAFETSELLNYAKTSLKDCIAIFEKDPKNVFKWDELREKVINEKLHFLLKYYSDNPSPNPEASTHMSQVHNLLEHIRLIEEDRNNLAKFAYLLARIKAKKELVYDKDDEFINKIYSWAKSEEDRKQLLAALTLFIYLNREEKDEQ